MSAQLHRYEFPLRLRVFLALLLVAGLIPTLSAASAASDTLLFDGSGYGAWTESNFGFEGSTRVEDGALILSMTDQLSGVTWTGPFPTDDYELTLQAKRMLGTDFFCGLTFPVEDAFMTLVVGGWGGAVVGLSSIDGKDASENETRTLMGFDNDRWYDIRLAVTGDSVLAWIDGESVVRFSREGHELSTRPEVLPSKPLGIAAWQSKAALRQIRLRLLPE